jgi:antirestriction protein ArdC
MSTVEERRDAFVERVTASLEEGVIPWRAEELPVVQQHNAVSGRSYSGLNALYLLEEAGTEGYSDPRWMTHKEAENHGLKPRLGEKSVKLEFWDKDDEGKAVGRTYSVFNIQQFYGMQNEKTAEEYQKPDYAKADEILRKTGMEPPADGSRESYQEAVKTLLDSAAEKSGLLNNIPSPHLKKLRMNLAETLLTHEAGIPMETPADAREQARDWAKTLRLNPKELFRAARDAMKLTNEVLAVTKNRGQTAELSGEAQSLTEDQERPFSPQAGQRVVFQPNDGEAKLTGQVLEVNEEAVVLRCGRATVTALKDRGTFSEASEPDRTHTKEYAKEQAQKHVGEQGNVFMGKGEDAIYHGTIVEVTPAYAIQKVGEDAILHRLKDLGKDQSLISVGQDISITKGGKGEILLETNKEQAQSREELSR